MKEEKHFTQQIIKYQEVKQYIGDGKYHFTVLNHEALVIFCVETGESHVVMHTINPIKQ